MRRSGGSVGSLRWTRETNGILRPRDRLRLLGQAVLFEFRVIPAELRRALGLHAARLARFDLEKLRIPDSPASREAEDLCDQVPAVANHSYRSYLWAVILAAHDGIPFDEEMVYVASLVHDIGFAEPQTTPDGRPCCLTLTGAEAALRIGAAAGWEQRRAEVAAEAITLHANLNVARRMGPEAYLLYASARLDQTGFRHWDLHPETVDDVLKRHPRQGWKRASCSMMKLQAQGTRARFYADRLGANRFITRAPFKD